MTARPRAFLPWLGALFSGLLLVLAFQPFGWWGCGWVALAPAWIALRGSAQVRQNPIRHGYLVGLIFILGCFWWIGAVTRVGLFIMALMLSFYPALWFLLVARVLRLSDGGGEMKFGRLAGSAVLAAAFWTTLEWLRSWFMKGFNWNELGVSQVPNAALRQLAALGGVPLLTFVLVLAGVLLGETAWSLGHRRWRGAGRAALPVACIFGVSWAYGWHRLERHAGELAQASISYACIQPDIPEIPYDTLSKSGIAEKEIAALTLEHNLSIRAISRQPELLVWPEAVTMQRLEGGHLINQVIQHLEQSYHGSILLGAEEFDHGKLYNAAYLAGPAPADLQRYRKVYLVILGEYLPWTDLFPWLKRWGRGFSATAGTEPGRFVLSRERLSLAPLICFEDTQPQVVNAAAALRPDFFVTMINAGWFSGPLATCCLKQHLENAILRCVEHDRPMLRCADTGISCEIDRDGGVTARLPAEPGAPLETQGILQGRLVLDAWEPTFYERWGDWIGLASRLLTLAACLSFLIARRKIASQKRRREEAR